jgi:hypothetical protein
MPAVEAYEFSAHVLHFVEPVAEAYVPALQYAQAVLPVMLLYLPAVHEVHIVTLLAPANAEKDPSGQA